MFRYIGNKTKLLPELLNAILTFVPNDSTVVDLMAGTGSVASMLRQNGFHVIASDMMTYSKHHLVTQLLLNAPPTFSSLEKHLPNTTQNITGYEKVINFLNSLQPQKGYFFNEFSSEGTPANGSPSRKYFTPDNAQKIDAIREIINYWISNNWITTIEESVLKHTLIMAINNVANISGTYGYFLSKFTKKATEPITLKPISFIKEGRIDNIVLQGFAEELSSNITADLCYIDPPYIKRQYAANYHILETIARGDFPDAIGKSGLRNWWDQHSKFCTKTQVRASFEQVISSMNCPKFIISYSEDGLLSIHELLELFAKFGSVSYQSIEHSRFRSNNSSLNKNLTEYIIKLEKKKE